MIEFLGVGNRSFWGSGRAREARKPSEKVGGFAGLPGAVQISKINDFPAAVRPVGDPAHRWIERSLEDLCFDLSEGGFDSKR